MPRSGFVVIVGRSNVGKSTLMNTMVGTKIAAVSTKPQMTRNIIHGVVNMPDGQVVIVDTPGVFKDKKSKLTGKLTKKISEALEDIDCIIYLVDPSKDIGTEERSVYGMVRHLKKPKLLVINKSDLHEDDRQYQKAYEAWGKDFDAVFALSALRASHIEPLKQKLVSLMPEGEPMYSGDQLTNIDNHFWIAEIVREKVFNAFEKEVPYSITVEVDNVETKKNEKDGSPIMVIEARILTNDERYKKILIGRGGLKIKDVGLAARKELEQATNTHIFLDLKVEVDRHWIERML